jgi:aldehyde dehydrogenase (NAD+)
MQEQYLNFIDGMTEPAQGGDWLGSVDPSTGQVFSQLPRSQAADIDHAVSAARRAFEQTWSKTPALERGRLLMLLSQRVLLEKDSLAALESRDTGKPLGQAQADAAALARYLEFYAGAADKLHGATIPYQDGYTVLTLREPHGITGHIVPWNYPMQIFGRSVAAALAAGNCCVVKPAEDACLSLLRVGQLAFEVGFPRGVLNVVAGLGTEAGAALASHTGINHISFTGSAATGTAVARAAAINHVPVTLELGGKSPQLVFADADIQLALPYLVSAIIQNAGQTCSAGSRLFVQQSVYPQVLEQVAQRFNQLRAGPANNNYDLGPLICAKQQQRVWDFLSDAHASGLEFAAQGQIVDDAPEAGFYQAPVLLANVPAQHKLMREEIFGPVLCISSFTDEQQAVAMANDSQYGLVAGLWTADGARQMRVARALQCGQVFINNYGAGGGVELPFGGVKHSGHGREKGFEALYGFTSLKTIAMRHG